MSATKVTIPTIGSELILAEPWTFSLHDEHRNQSLWDHLLPHVKRGNSYTSRGNSQKVTLQPGTLLQVDRVFIRKNASDFDSVSFFVLKAPDFPPSKRKHLARFWAKLFDVNQMVGTWNEATLSRP